MPDNASKKNSIGDMLWQFKNFISLIVIFIIASIICVRGDRNLFLNPTNLANVLRSISENGIMAVGMTLVILLGDIDLSVGAVLGLTATGAAVLLVQNGLNVGLAIMIVLIISLVFGLFNGVVRTKLGIQAFIVTLASMSIARGLARTWSKGYSVPIAFGTEPGMVSPVYGMLGERIWGIPLPTICFVIIAVIFAVLLKYTRFGRYVYAIGGNETAAYLCGIKVDKVKIILFSLCGLLSGIAGVIHAAQVSQGSPNDGIGYEMNAIAAVAIGGTSMAGGKGTIIGTVVGALTLGILDNMLGLKNIDNNMQQIVKGFIIIGAVVLQKEKKR